MTDEGMDRLVDRVRGDGYTYDEVERDIRAALRQAADEALERAAQAFAEAPATQHSGAAVASILRYLKEPAAAPAAEPSEPVAPKRQCEARLVRERLRYRCTKPDRHTGPHAGGDAEWVNTADVAQVTEPVAPAPSAAEKRIAELESALRWALGEEDHFPPRELEQGQYWWRIELRRRAKLAALASPVAQGKETRKP